MCSLKVSFGVSAIQIVMSYILWMFKSFQSFKPQIFLSIITFDKFVRYVTFKFACEPGLPFFTENIFQHSIPGFYVLFENRSKHDINI